MRVMQYGYFTLSDLPNKLSSYLSEIFDFPEDKTRILLQERFSNIRKDLLVFIEYPYVDPLYRNTYYNYFSTKHITYQKNCVRLTFFEKDFEIKKLDSLEKVNSKKCLGYICIKPTFPSIFGRGVLSPLILKDSNFFTCSIETKIIVKGQEFTFSGFPFSSQDGEYTKCAETTIWETLEYFGNKYPDYRTILPSEIHKILNRLSVERQIPSPGLKGDQISYALRELGFGVKLYNRETYQTSSPMYSEFYRILHYYVDSAIPVLAILKSKTRPSLLHAVLYIGYKLVDNTHAGDLEDDKNSITFDSNNIYDFSDLIHEYVICDDNRLPFQMANFTVTGGSPSFNYLNYYSTPGFKDLELTQFIVPLHPRIYLEASQARNFIVETLQDEASPFRNKNNENLTLRLFATQGRAFKKWILQQKEISTEIKNIVVYATMPKFIYVGELSNSTLIGKQRANGFIIIDATQPFAKSKGNLLIAYAFNTITYFENNGLLTTLDVGNDANGFIMYSNLNYEK